MDGLIPIAQVALPGTLILWLLVLPAQSNRRLVLQALASGLVLVTVSRVAIWGLPPIWVVWAMGGLWLLALAIATLRSREPVFRYRLPGFLAMLGNVALILLAIVALVPALLALRPHQPAVLNLATPLGAGRYLVAHGGANEVVNPHLMTLNPTVPRFAEWRGQSFAVDLLAQGDYGLTEPLGRPSDPALYPIFGTPILAPCSGRVAVAQDGVADNPVPTMNRAQMLGNHVILACDRYWVVLAHFRQGSVQVGTGDDVKTGAVLGEVGNSGNSSQPHLHVHVQFPAGEDSPIRAEPLPFRIEGRYLVRNDMLIVP